MNRRFMILAGVVAAVLVIFFAVRFEASKVAQGAVDRALASLPPGWVVTHGGGGYDAVSGTETLPDVRVSHDGVQVFSADKVVVSGVGAPDARGTPKRIGSIVVFGAAGGFDMTMPGPDGAAKGPTHLALSARKVRLDGIAAADLRDIGDPAAYPDGKPAWTDMRPLIDHVQITGGREISTGAQPGAIEATISEARSDGITGHQLPQPPTPEALKQPGYWILAETSSFGIKSSSAHDLRETIDLQGKPLEVTLKSLSITGGTPGHFDRFDYDGLAGHFADPALDLRIGHVGMGNIDFAGAIAPVVRMMADPQHPDDAAALQMLRGFHVGTFTEDDFKIDGAQVPHIGISALHWTSSQASDGGGALALEGFEISPGKMPLPPDVAAQMAQFGTDHLAADLHGKFTEDRGSHRYKLSQFDLVLHDLGSLHVTGTVLDNGDQPQLEHAKLRWEDASLTGRVFKLMAYKQQTTVQAVRAELAIPLASLGVLLSDQPDATAQIAAFLDHQHDLMITLDPPAPVSQRDVMATSMLGRAHALGLHIQGE